MTDFNYKKYSLEHLENWMHDAMSSADATPQEIYDVIVGVVKENYYYHKKYVSDAYELLSLLNNNNGQSYEDVIRERDYYENVAPSATQRDMDNTLSCDKDDQSPECKGAWNDFWEGVDEGVRARVGEDKVVKWQLPVEQIHDEYFVSFPDDLLEAAKLKEGDTVEWVDNHNGSYTIRKVTKTLGMDEC